MSNAAFALPDRTLVLDRYRPLRPLGRGGSGSVWLAHDERTGLEVALKIVPREGKRAARASREMEAASRLRHERCVRAYDFARGRGSRLHRVRVRPRGARCARPSAATTLGDAEAVEIAAQVLDGLAHAHRRGIVHRDVKPSNVLVEESEELSVRVLDFGLAQFDEADTLTAVGDVPGTLAYISPERLSGEEATERSDVWAVGVILWEALAGSHPFWGVPLPQVASTIAGGRAAALRPPPRPAAPAARRRRRRARGRPGAKRPSAARLAAELREAYVAARAAPREPRRSTARRRRASGPRRARRPRRRPARPPPPVRRARRGRDARRRLAAPVLAARAARARSRSPRALRRSAPRGSGLAIALAAPRLPARRTSRRPPRSSTACSRSPGSR